MLYYIENSKTFSAHGRLDLLDEVCAFKSPATRRAGAMPQSVEALQLPGNPEAIEYPEVELGIQDRFPSEVSESPGKDADDDKAGQLVQLYIAFVNQMMATRPEILRGVRVWQLLRYLPSAWLRDDVDSLHSFSQQTTQFDQFWSHSWKGQRWSKYINILYLHNCLPASIAGSLSAGVACGLVSAGLLGARQRWCLLFGLVAFCITLLLWRPRKLVFLDIACIHQTDEGRKGEAIMSMGAFLKQSSSMLVLWDPTWVTRLRLGFFSVSLEQVKSLLDCTQKR